MGVPVPEGAEDWRQKPTPAFVGSLSLLPRQHPGAHRSLLPRETRGSFSLTAFLGLFSGVIHAIWFLLHTGQASGPFVEVVHIKGLFL